MRFLSISKSVRSWYLRSSSIAWKCLFPHSIFWFSHHLLSSSFVLDFVSITKYNLIFSSVPSLEARIAQSGLYVDHPSTGVSILNQSGSLRKYLIYGESMSSFANTISMALSYMIPSYMVLFCLSSDNLSTLFSYESISWANSSRVYFSHVVLYRISSTCILSFTWLIVLIQSEIYFSGSLV